MGIDRYESPLLGGVGVRVQEMAGELRRGQVEMWKFSTQRAGVEVRAKILHQELKGQMGQSMSGG